MLFNPSPKEKIKEFFGMRKELRNFVKFLKDESTRMIVITGPRRTGKTSLIKVGLNESKQRYIYVNLWLFVPFGKEKFYEIMGKEFKNFIRKYKIKLPFFELEEIEIGKHFVEYLSNIEKRVILCIDEAQEAVRYGLEYQLAYIYDNLRNVKIVISGSKIGIMEKIIASPSSPLYGRAYAEIRTRKFTKKEAVEFLKKGMREIGIKNVNEKELENIAYTLNFIPGWLTYFGWLVYSGKSFNVALKRTLEHAKNLSRKEFENFLRNRLEAREKYIEIIKLLKNPCSWSEIKRVLISKYGKITDAKIAKYIHELIKYGFVEKRDGKYVCIDRILSQAYG